MNYQRLNELAAKAMGYEELHLPKDGGRNPFVMYSRPGMDNIVTSDWNPSTCADDALVLLEKSTARTGRKGWKLMRMNDGDYGCVIPWNRKGQGTELTAPLAMTLCALRAAGISESEIQEALK